MCAIAWIAIGRASTWTTRRATRTLIAARIAALVGNAVDYLDVETDGAARAAQLIADLV